MPRIAPSKSRAYIASTTVAGSLTRGVQQRTTNTSNEIRHWNPFEINWWVIRLMKFMILELRVIQRYNVNNKVVTADESALPWGKRNPFFFGWRQRQNGTILKATSALSPEWFSNIKLNNAFALWVTFGNCWEKEIFVMLFNLSAACIKIYIETYEQ